MRSPVPQVPPPAGIPFNAAQSRHLAIALDRVDEALLELVAEHRALRADAGPDRVLRPQRHDLAPQVVQSAAETAEALRRRLRSDVEQLALEPLPELASRRLSTLLTSARVIVVDARSDEMAAYGDLHPDAPPVLDRWLGEWEDALSALLRLLEPEGGHAARG